jgi:pyruvate kinase
VLLLCLLCVAGRTAQLVAKYRPPMPILTLVVPRLVSDSLKWKLEGR